MADPVTPPVEVVVPPGNTTSEYALSKIVIWGGIAVAVLSALAELLTKLSSTLPSAPPWLVALGTTVGTVAAAVAAIYYSMIRKDVKTAALASGNSLTQAKPADAAAANLGK
jgi:preprotein translocase subunit SecY